MKPTIWELTLIRWAAVEIGAYGYHRFLADSIHDQAFEYGLAIDWETI